MMMRSIATLGFAAVLAVCALSAPAATAQTDEQIALINAALPASAATPAQPRKVLIFTLTKGFRHGSIPVGVKSLTVMGEKTGAYSATHSEDPEMFRPETLAQFDAVIMLNTTQDLWEDLVLKDSFREYIKSGHGLVGIHAATDCFYNWSEYGDMIGGYFDGHPWGSRDTVTIKLDDPAHCINRAFRGRKFDITDEIYQFRDEPYSRDKLRVLLSLDTSPGSKTDMTKSSIKRTDGDFGVAWVQRYGEGRVFYCSLGHNDHVYWDARVLQHYLDGIQFALGDLEADTTPSNQLSAEYLNQSKSQVQSQALDDAFAALRQFSYGGDTAVPLEIHGLVVASHGNEAEQQDLARRLAEILASDVSPAVKEFAAKQINYIGGPAAVEAIAPLLSQDQSSDNARLALEDIPGPEADQALLSALGSASGKAKAGIINSLAVRRTSGAVETIIPLLNDGDPVVNEAAVHALGALGGEAALKALAEGMNAASPEARPRYGDAILAAADRYAAEGNAEIAAHVYAHLMAEAMPEPIRLAAFQGAVAVGGEDAVPLVVENLSSDNEKLRALAAGAARDLPGAEATRALVDSLAALDAEAKASVIRALGDRGDAAARQTIVDAANSGDAAVQLAAVESLKSMADASVIPLLAGKAAVDDEIGEAARNTLALANAEGFDAAMIAALEGVPADQRVALIDALSARRAADAVPALNRIAGTDEPAARVAALRALALIAGPDSLPQVIAVVLDAPTDEVREVAVDTASTLADKKTEHRADAALEALPTAAADVRKYAAIITLLGQIGDDAGLPAIDAALASGPPEVQQAAANALTEWPTATPLDRVLELAKNPKNDTQRTVALRGYFRMLGLPSDRTADDTLARYVRGLELAPNVAEKKQAISGLATVRAPRVREVLQQYLNDPDVRDEAQQALDALANVQLVGSASHGSDSAGLALDGDPATRWSTGDQMKEGMWYQVDLGWERNVKGFTLDSTASAGDYPRGYEVYVSSNPENWGAPVATGRGEAPVITVSFPPKHGRYLRVVQTGPANDASGLWWSIHELKVDAE